MTADRRGCIDGQCSIGRLCTDLNDETLTTTRHAPAWLRKFFGHVAPYKRNLPTLHMSAHSPTNPMQDDAETSQRRVLMTPSNMLLYMIVGFIFAGTILRFWPRSDMWLDEALSLNIAQTGLDGIPDALRRDGHPPLYYYLLWGWSKIGGDSTWWIRALSGVIYTLSLPLFYLAGRRVSERSARHIPQSIGVDHHRGGLIAVAIASIAAYGVRFGSETRMYALVILLTTIAYLVFSRFLFDDPQEPKFSFQSWKFILIGGLITTALLWTHYWSMWLCAAVGIALIVHWVRRPESRGNTTAAILALVFGGILFLPWLSTLLYQSAHTGTPWGEPVGVVETLTSMISSFSGDQLTSYILVSLALVAVVVVLTPRVPGGVGNDTPLLVLSERFQPRVLGEALILILTVGIGWATSVVSGSTFQPRYGAVVFALFVVIVAAGLHLFWNHRLVAVILAVFFILSLYVNAVEIRLDRTQAGDVADEIALMFEPGDVVVSCPDQIAVATQRALEQRGDVDTTLVPYPTAGDPHFVDWVDYAERNEAASPQAFWDEIADSVNAAPRIFFVRAGGYETFGNACAELGDVIGIGRERRLLIERGEAYESMDLWVYQLPS